jgi:L-threonylcarbamoyladenylate synthase
VIGPVDLFTGAVDPTIGAQSPGQQLRHYSPVAPTLRFEHSEREPVVNSVDGIILIVGHLGSGSLHHVVEMPAEPMLYARKLYQTLRMIDQQKPAAIMIEMPPDEPRWFAVRDRLKRASVEWNSEIRREK